MGVDASSSFDIEARFLHACKHVHERYYSHNYKDPEPPHGDHDLQFGVPHHNHGLAHSIRKAKLVPVVHDAFSKKSLLSLPKQTLFHVELALLFESTGRASEISYHDDPERHDLYDERARQNLREYCQIEMVPRKEITEEEVNMTLQALDGMYQGSEAGKVRKMVTLLEVCHTLDLLRCSPSRNPTDQYEDKLGRAEAQSLSIVAEQLLIATGNRLVISVTSRDTQTYQKDPFQRCSKDPEFCLKQIQQSLCQETNTSTPKRTFKNSKYLEMYGAVDNPKVALLDYDDQVWGVVRQLVEKSLAYAPYDTVDGHKKRDAAKTFFQDLKTEWKESLVRKSRSEGKKDSVFGEEIGDSRAVAVRLWSSMMIISPGVGSDRELCSFINQAIREDREEVMAEVVQFSRLMNSFLVNRRVSGSGKVLSTKLFDELPCPPDTPTKHHEKLIINHFQIEQPDDTIDIKRFGYRVMYRGGGIDPSVKRFFEKGRKYRVPAFLSTSFSEEKANQFIGMVQPPLECIKWYIHVPLFAGCCTNANFIEEFTNVEGEFEFLFVPYSVFTVLDVKWRKNPNPLFPHENHLLASEDNRREREDLPSTPWT